MAGLLTWVADVVAGGGAAAGADDEEEGRSPVVFKEEKHPYAAELRRSIQELRQCIPPPHIAQRLLYLHAHSLASNVAVALQLHAHSTTREQAQMREVILQEENVVYENAISDCQKKLQEKLLEVDLLQSKLKEMELAEQDLRAELESNLATKERDHLDSKIMQNSQLVTAPLEISKSEDLQEKKTDVIAQREKLLEKQLHNLIEQLTRKQVQAEGLRTEVRAKDNELERLNALRRNLESRTMSTDHSNVARSRFTR